MFIHRDSIEPGTFQLGTFQSGTLFARRCICYLMRDMAQEALGDAMQSLVHRPAWPTAFYLQVAAFKSIGMDNEAEETLKVGASLEVGSPKT